MMILTIFPIPIPSNMRPANSVEKPYTASKAYVKVDMRRYSKIDEKQSHNGTHEKGVSEAW
jgi:hypothetical protein